MWLTFILGHWRLLSALILTVALAITIEGYRADISYWQGKDAHAEAQVAVDAHVLNIQNASIQKQASDQNTVQAKLNQSTKDNASLSAQLQKQLTLNATTKIGPSCSNAMDYLRARAPSLVPSASTAVPPVQ